MCSTFQIAEFGSVPQLVKLTDFRFHHKIQEEVHY